MNSKLEKRRGRWWKRVLGLLLVVIIALAVLLLNVDTIALSQINKALDRYLVAGGNLEAVDISLLEARVKLSGLHINPPPGFEPHPLLDLQMFEVDIAPWALLKGRIVVDDLSMQGVSLNVVRDKNGRLSPLDLIAIEASSKAPGPEKEQDDTEPPWIPAVDVNTIHMAGLSFRLVDHLMKKDWSAGLGADLAIQGVRLEDLLELDIAVGRFDLRLNDILVEQLPGFGKAPLLAVNQCALASEGIDLKSSRLSMSDIILDKLSASLERNADGEINLVKLFQTWLPSEMGDDSDKSGPSAPPSKTSEPAFEIPVVVVENMHLKSISAQLLDSIEGQPWRAGFKELEIQATDVEVGDLAEQAVALASLDLDLKGIAVDQPPGFSETPLLSMGNLKLASQGIDMGASTVSISDLILDRLSISVERNASDGVNLLILKEAWLPASVETSGAKQGSSVSTAEASGSDFELPTAVVDNIELKSISAQVLASIEDQPWRAGFDGLDIHVTGVEVGARAEQVFSLESFDLDLKGIAVDQLPGFGTEKLFNLERFAIISEKTDKSNAELVIKQVSLTGLTSSVVRHADGTTNLQVLSKALLEKDEEARASREDPTTDKKALSEASALQPVLFEQISLVGGPVSYRDEYFAEETLVASLDNIQLNVTDLRLFSKAEGADPASAAISFELAQPGELPTAHFGSLAALGPLGYGIPMVNSQMRLVGLKLDTLGSLVPKTTRTALGASGLDGALALALDAEAINLNAAVLTDHGIKYKGLKVQGPLEAPVVEPGPLMAGVFNRVSEGLVNLGKGGLKTGVNVAEGGVEVVKELGSGAVEVGKNLGKSLFSATAGIVTMDKGKVKEGASGTTKGTVDITKGSVKGSSHAVGSSLKGSASELKGQSRVEAWEEGIPERYRTSMQHAETVLAQMPYPPVTK